MSQSAPVPSAERELPAPFLATLVAELDTPATVGILLGGSYVRGAATAWSDVDLACFVADEGQVQPKRLFYRADRLVSVASKSLAGVRASLSRPQAAMWVVPGLAGCHILLDKQDAMAELLAELHAFRWASVQAAADRCVGDRLMLMVELVHKVIGGLVSDDAGRMARPVGELLSDLTEVMAVGRGVLITSDNSYYEQVQEAAGPDSAWTRAHRLLAGLDAPPASPLLPTRSRAALQLYCATVHKLGAVIALEQQAVIGQAVRLAERVLAA